MLNLKKFIAAVSILFITASCQQGPGNMLFSKGNTNGAGSAAPVANSFATGTLLGSNITKTNGVKASVLPLATSKYRLLASRPKITESSRKYSIPEKTV